MNLPPMPEPLASAGETLTDDDRPEFSARDLRDYGDACYAAGMEAAAKVCSEVAAGYEDDSGKCADRFIDTYRDKAQAAEMCADSIRGAAKPGE